MQHIHISVDTQTLRLFSGENLLRTYPVSTSKYGRGCEEGSFKTPTGRFQISEKIGDGHRQGEVFRSRQATGNIGDETNENDLIQTRILWLEGLEAHNANTRQRYIYIHGTNHESKIGQAVSQGCVRMRNADIVDLFNLVDKGIGVVIE